MIQSTKLKIVLPDSEETLEDAEEIRLKMRNKMVQPDYGNLNALYETFVSQKESSVEKTYLSIPSTSNICSESNEVRYGYIRNHKKTVKNGQARTRESEEYKKKPKIQSRSQEKSSLRLTILVTCKFHLSKLHTTPAVVTTVTTAELLVHF
ncbi:hypothetical protein Tco_0544864 [Tanacetum coccineum]